MRHVALICGLAVEARIARYHGFPVACGGSDADRAAALAGRLVQDGARALVSFGLAGGLDPDLVAGDLVVAAEVVDETGRWVGSEAWRDRIAERLTGARVGVVAAGRSVVGDIVAKRALRAATGAMIADLESGAVARVAASAGIPFLVVRAVADDARRAVPPLAASLIDARGRVAIARATAHLAWRPGLVVSFVGLARDTRRALATLRVAARALAADSPD